MKEMVNLCREKPGKNNTEKLNRAKKMLDFGASKPGVRERATNPPTRIR